MQLSEGLPAMTTTTPEQRTEWSILTDRLTADHAGHDVTI